MKNVTQSVLHTERAFMQISYKEAPRSAARLRFEAKQPHAAHTKGSEVKIERTEARQVVKGEPLDL